MTDLCLLWNVPLCQTVAGRYTTETHDWCQVGLVESNNDECLDCQRQQKLGDMIIDKPLILIHCE